MKCPYFLEECIIKLLNTATIITKTERLSSSNANSSSSSSSSKHYNSNSVDNISTSNGHFSAIEDANSNGNVSGDFDTFSSDTGSSAFSSYNGLKSKNSSATPSPRNRISNTAWTQIPWTSNGPVTVLTPSSIDSGLQCIWLTLRYIRGVPVEVIHAVSDRLGAGVISILW